MPEVGVRELKIRASEIIRLIRERKVRYIITYRGRPVATLGPIEGSPIHRPERTDALVWHELERLGESIGKGWRSSKTSSELLSESRR